jgi:hypothetical protein
LTDTEMKRLAFAQTVASAPIDHGVAKHATSVPQAQDGTVGVTPVVPLESFDTPHPTTRTVLTGASRLSSLASRLRAPTRWHKRTWIRVWVVLMAGLVVLIARLSWKRASIASKTQVQMAVVPAAAPAKGPLQEPVEPAPSPSAFGAVGEPAPVAPELPSTEGTFSEDLMRRGLGFVTVHSAEPHANVYVMFRRYGAVEEKLMIPCGKRFIGIGLPARDRQEPTWLAPGKLTNIPCGGSVEMTMNPRRLR